jgi:hypothetical protein
MDNVWDTSDSHYGKPVCPSVCRDVQFSAVKSVDPYSASRNGHKDLTWIRMQNMGKWRNDSSGCCWCVVGDGILAGLAWAFSYVDLYHSSPVISDFQQKFVVEWVLPTFSVQEVTGLNHGHKACGIDRTFWLFSGVQGQCSELGYQPFTSRSLHTESHSMLCNLKYSEHG